MLAKWFFVLTFNKLKKGIILAGIYTLFTLISCIYIVTFPKLNSCYIPHQLSRPDVKINNNIKAIYKIDSSKNSSFCQLNNQLPEEYYLF
jgi:uncharacterized membrane protein YccF (DUF307 family)